MTTPMWIFVGWGACALIVLLLFMFEDKIEERSQRQSDWLEVLYKLPAREPRRRAL